MMRGAAFVLVVVAVTSGCRRSAPATNEAATSAVASASIATSASSSASSETSELWNHAASGDDEDLATLAVHEGAQGLIERASDKELRSTALRAMGLSRGWVALPALVEVAKKGGDDGLLAEESIVRLALRPVAAEDPEDAEELRAGCLGLDAIVRASSYAKHTRVAALRAHRMMPCSPLAADVKVTDLEAE